MLDPWYQGYEDVLSEILWEAVEDLDLTFAFTGLSTGSRTIDADYDLEIAFDFEGLRVTKKVGELMGSDLFDELDYFPEKLVWSGSDERLHTLLENLCEERDLDPGELTTEVITQIGNPQFDEFLQKERQATESSELAGLREQYRELQSEYTITGLPWDLESGGDRCALKLVFGDRGWEARFFEPSGNETALESEDVEETTTYDTLSDAWRDIQYDVACDWEEFQELLVKSDPDWKKVILLSRWLEWQEKSGAGS